MQSMKPCVSFQVPNMLTGEGSLEVDITFESMDDFSPAAVARNVDSLAKLLETRTQLANLGTYLDGKVSAEKLIAQALKDPALLQSLSAAPKAVGTEPAESAEAGARARRPAHDRTP
jgi:type VI secretion system protein ImpB